MNSCDTYTLYIWIFISPKLLVRLNRENKYIDCVEKFENAINNAYRDYIAYTTFQIQYNKAIKWTVTHINVHNDAA